MNNIKSYTEYIAEQNWKSITKDDKGNIMVDDIEIDSYGSKLIDRSVSRAQDDTIDKICGGISSIEKEIENYPSNVNQDSLQNKLGLNSENKIPVGTCGYVEIECNDDIFKINPSNIGRGEVLLAWTYEDVRMKNRELGEIGDCAIYDINLDKHSEDNILYNIEVKSGGSEFALREPVENNDYTEAIYQHILTRYKNSDKPLIFIFFNNDLKGANHNTCDGFFWIYCGTKTDDHSGIKKSLENNMSNIIKYDYTKPKNGLFAIELQKEKDGGKFIIYTRKSEN